MIPRKAVQEFKGIYRKKFGEELTEKDALDKALRIFNLYKTVFGPDNSSQRSENKLNNNYE